MSVFSEDKNSRCRKNLVEKYEKYINNCNTEDKIQNNSMRKIYESIINDKKLEKHLNFDINDRKKFLMNFPYENPTYNEDYVYNNILMFYGLSEVRGYFYTNDKVKVIDFDGNYFRGKINSVQNCLLPENIFLKKYNYKSVIPPLKINELPSFNK